MPKKNDTVAVPIDQVERLDLLVKKIRFQAERLDFLEHHWKSSTQEMVTLLEELTKKIEDIEFLIFGEDE